MFTDQQLRTLLPRGSQVTAGSKRARSRQRSVGALPKSEDSANNRGGARRTDRKFRPPRIQCTSQYALRSSSTVRRLTQLTAPLLLRTFAPIRANVQNHIGNLSNYFNLEIGALLGYYAALGGSYVPTFRDNLPAPSSRVRKSKKLFDP
jgi:hypothetical protein